MLSPETEAAVREAVDVPGRETWREAADAVFKDYWGPDPPDADSFERQLVRALASVSYVAFDEDEDAARDLFLDIWFSGDKAPHPPVRNSSVAQAVHELYLSTDWETLPPRARTLQALWHMFVSVEGVIRPHLAILSGVCQIISGASVELEALVLDSEDKIRSTTDAKNKLGKSLGPVKARGDLDEEMDVISDFLGSISRKLNGQTPRLGLDDVRNQIGHMDFSLTDDGDLLHGYNLYYRAGEPGASLIDRDEVLNRLHTLHGLESALAAWSGFIATVAEGGPP